VIGRPQVEPQVEPKERADAARNRAAVLAAALDLFTERGVAAVTMDEIAASAGVGKGTLYRRFGDKAGLAVALLDAGERTLQARMLSGPGPLGPGGPRSEHSPVQRLSAFVRAYVDYVLSMRELVLLSQTAAPDARHRTGAHAFWVTHCRILLEQAGAPDPAIRAEALLATLTAEQLGYWTTTAGLTRRQVTAAVTRLAEALAAPE
jgi:AcrR family transcriptional regulator